MGPTRYRSTSPITRSKLPASKALAKSNQTLSKRTLIQDHDSSDNEHRDGIEFGPEWNEHFIQSIEGLLPGQDRKTRKFPATLPPASSETPPATPDQLIKVERVSNSVYDIYEVSPRRYVYKGADIGRRRTSRSTAQLTTPGSSPVRKHELRDVFPRAMVVDPDLIYEGNGQQRLSQASCTPPASNQKENNFSKQPASVAPANPVQRLSPEAFQPLGLHGGRQNSSIGVAGHSTTSDLPLKSSLLNHRGLQRSRISTRTLSTKTLGPQNNRDQFSTHESQCVKPPTEYPPILPPRKILPAILKKTASPAGSVRTTSSPTSPSTLEGPSHVRQCILPGKPCYKSSCPHCIQKTVLKDDGIEVLEKLPHTRRMKSGCPSSVSSFGSADDVPPSGEMRLEVGKIVTESARKFASDRISDISPSLRHNSLSIRPDINRNAFDRNEAANDTYDDFDEESLLRKDPRRAIFGKATHNITGHGQTKPASSIIEKNGRKREKQLPQTPSRSLRSFFAVHDLSQKSNSLLGKSGQGQEAERINGSSNDVIDDERGSSRKDSSSEPDGQGIQRASAQAPLGLTVTSQGAKRVREMEYDWHILSNNEYMPDKDEVVEIDRDAFALSENRKKKRHKDDSGQAYIDSVLANPVPKEDPGEESENLFPAQDSMAVTISNQDRSDNNVQDGTPCDYYMNTYWECGRASDGRRARDGFISYSDFKAYSRKNRQPTDNGCLFKFKTDLKHTLLCEYHASLRQDLHRLAWNFEANPGFSFMSNSKNDETRRKQDETIGNVPSQNSPSREAATGADGEVAEIAAEIVKEIEATGRANIAHLRRSNKSTMDKVKKGLAQMQNLS